MENKENINSWLFGLEKFFQFRNEQRKHEFMRAIIQLRYYKIEDRPWALKKLLALDAKYFPDKERDNRWNVYTEMMVKEEIPVKLLFWVMHTIWGEEKFINDLYLFFNNTDTVVANDLFSKSQVLSKIWMAESIRKFATKPMNILLVGGWYGQHRWYFNDINIKCIVNVDLDERATFVSKTIADRDEDPYVAIAGDINNLLKDNGIVNVDGTDMAFDIIINTSAEHMSEDWFNRLPENQTVLIQSNDMFDIEGHVNCVNSLEELKTKFPLRHTNVSGQMAISHGNRYMVYGIK